MAVADDDADVGLHALGAMRQGRARRLVLIGHGGLIDDGTFVHAFLQCRARVGEERRVVRIGEPAEATARSCSRCGARATRCTARRGPW